MITANIKTATDSRVEKWDDTQVAKEDATLVVDNNVYVLAFNDEAGQETTRVVSKHYWDMVEEIVELAADKADTYPKLTQFTRQALTDLGDTFRPYLDIENKLIGQQSFTDEENKALEAELLNVGKVNGEIQIRLYSVMGPIESTNATNEYATVILDLLDAIVAFCVIFDRCLERASDVQQGLSLRASGGDYTPLDYLKDLNGLKERVEQRRSIEARLTETRNIFNQHAKTVSVTPTET